MSRFKDIAGQKFSRLTVVEKTDQRSQSNSVIWRCLCDCGNETTATITELKNERKRSCGCLNREVQLSYKDMTGERYGRLTVVKEGKKIGNKRFWICLCECGTEREVEGHSLRSGKTKSCGCLQKDLLTTHGHTSNARGRCTKTYSTWRSMMRRCYDPRLKCYHRYGGRGIKVCKRWHKFENFLADMGEKPAGMSLDRINNDKGYCPSNCRYTDVTTQNRNKTGTLPITHNGETKVASAWCEELGMNKSGFLYRYHHPTYDAFTPIRKRRAV